jgi:hypothetical protein
MKRPQIIDHRIDGPKEPCSVPLVPFTGNVANAQIVICDSRVRCEDTVPHVQCVNVFYRVPYPATIEVETRPTRNQRTAVVFGAYAESRESHFSDIADCKYVTAAPLLEEK